MKPSLSLDHQQSRTGPTITDFLEWLAASIPVWHADALCAQTDPEAFFPEIGGSTREAKATCRRCPVRTDCLLYALDREERFGIWGGTSERDRRKMLNRHGSNDAA